MDKVEYTIIYNRIKKIRKLGLPRQRGELSLSLGWKPEGHMLTKHIWVELGSYF